MKGKQAVLSMVGTFVVGLAVGGALLYNDSVYDAVKDAVNGGTSNAVGGITGTTDISVSDIDLETALAAVQSDRSKVLEAQLQEQLKAVQARNDQIAKLNNALIAINAELGRLAPDAKAEQAVTLQADSVAAFNAASVPAPKTKGELLTTQNTIKSQIDSLSNSQQMDMLQLQSLTNKQNEAFDVMTEFIKKMQDSRSSIIGNMR